ncbi:MAG: hypothetical protein ACFFF4_09985, partial [Candidatus Thorarchaeota archaeon]
NSKNCARAVNVREKKTSAAERLLNLTTDDIRLFTSDDRAFVRLKIGNHWEIHSVKSKKFERYLAHLLYTTEGTPPSSEAINSTQNVLAARAHFESPEYQLHNRVAEYEGCIYYDLTNREHKVVKISVLGWEILDETPVPMFRRYKHQRPCPLPEVVPDEDIKPTLELLLDFINLDPTDRDGRILFIVEVLSYFIPDIPHPVSVVYGDQGSAKSTAFKVIKKLVDPSKIEIMAFPKGVQDLVQALDHQWFIGFDNVGELKEYHSDFLCRAVTGEGFLKRELYSDDEDVIYTYKRCIGLNGINNAATKPDLLDRSALYRFPRIEEENRRDEKTFWYDFEIIRPRLLGAIFTALSKAFAQYHSVDLTGLYRLADWTKWGCALAEAIGYNPDDFLTAYAKNRQVQTDEALANDDVATSLFHFIQERREWYGTMTELLKALSEAAEILNITTTGPGWPKAPNSLSKRLNSINTTLNELGIEVNKDRDNKKRLVSITYVERKSQVSRVMPRGLLEQYYDDSDDAPKSDIVTETAVSLQNSEECDDSDGCDDVSVSSPSALPKDKIGAIRETPGTDILKSEQDKRYKEFVKKAKKLKKKKDEWITQLDLDAMYPDEGRLQVARDLLDWENLGLVFGKRDSKEGPRWKITELIK